MQHFQSGRSAAPGRMARRKGLVAALLGLALCHLPLAHGAATGLPEGLKPPATAKVMPAFELPTTAGRELDSRSLAGQVVVIRFWASW